MDPSDALCGAADPLAMVRFASKRAGHGLYLGSGVGAHLFAPPEQGLLVLGPPRSGKTASVVIPNVLAACGPVLVASTKRDILDATWQARRRVGPCVLFDPGGEIEAPPGVRRVGWSPLRSSRTYEGAVLVVEAMADAGRGGGGRRDESHWVERAQALLASLFHAGALDGARLREVVSWVDRREASAALSILARADAKRPCDALTGIVRTDEREQSGIWSTASGVLAAYRSEAALRSSEGVEFDAAGFVAATAGSGTVYVCASGQHQRHAAPLVVGLVEEVKAAAYWRSARVADRGAPSTGRGGAPVLAVLDELAHIAPLRDLPALVAEGGSQGIVTLACLQDLSQARARWGALGDAFPSFFGTTMLMPGIADLRTLELVSALSGEHDVPVHSTTGGSLWRSVLGGTRRSTTVSTRRERRLPVDAVAAGQPGMALGFGPKGEVGYIGLTPHHSSWPWSAIRAMHAPDRSFSATNGLGRRAAGRRVPGPERGLSR